MIFKATDYEVITYPEGGMVVNRSDGASIPTDPRNRDYQEFLEIEKADEKKEIKRTTIVESEPEPSEIEILKAKVAKLESDMITVKTDVSDLKVVEEVIKA